VNGLVALTGGNGNTSSSWKHLCLNRVDGAIHNTHVSCAEQLGTKKASGVDLRLFDDACWDRRRASMSNVQRMPGVLAAGSLQSETAFCGHDVETHGERLTEGMYAVKGRVERCTAMLR
jgi:hypothetical protein